MPIAKVTGTPAAGNAAPSADWRATVTGGAIASFAAVSVGRLVNASRLTFTTLTTALGAPGAVHDPYTAVTT
ncbi:hypothetical protein [Amycolatopsis sp. Hca4]|uniref:hypothetical protein n=1 Tax=Amycolatopsis sp. Hca4 TaxID=2742131 RepID=UPI001591A8C1|nr:hypothetical protein [Amycolatopsis sp. Hca4]QKV73891.1 hypothetical protein HUT10_08985 [Amycolatopsis sp. Hca4]